MPFTAWKHEERNRNKKDYLLYSAIQSTPERQGGRLYLETH